MIWQIELTEALGGILAVKILERRICEFIVDLIDEGGDPNAIANNDTVPAWTKILSDDVPLCLVETLFNKGAVIPSHSDSEDTLLYTAITNNVEPEIIMFLLGKGAKASYPDIMGKNILNMAIQNKFDLRIIQLMVKAGASSTQKSMFGDSPILIAAEFHANADVLAFLLDSGADVNDINDDSSSVLGICCANKSVDQNVLELLINRGADINYRDAEGYTPLAILCTKEFNSQYIPIFAELGVDLEQINDGKTLLMIAVEFSNSSAVTELVELGSPDIDVVHEETGKTALHFACENFDESIVMDLLVNNADCTIKDKEHHKPFDLIVEETDKDIFLIYAEA